MKKVRFNFNKCMKSLGFSLIELMVVIAIVGILAAVAVPSYRDYVIRGEITEAISFIPTIRNIFSEYHALNGFPTSDTALDDKIANISTKHIQKVTINPCSGNSSFSYMRISLSDDLQSAVGLSGSTSHGNRARIYLNIEEVDGILKFDCHVNTVTPYNIDPKYVPSNCTAIAVGCI